VALVVDQALSASVDCPDGVIYLPMRVTTDTVVSGTVVLADSAIADGTDVFVLTRDPDETPSLSAEELAELAAGLAEADRGEMISGEELFLQLRRHG
jgi:predicted transcriptional regulator